MSVIRNKTRKGNHTPEKGVIDSLQSFLASIQLTIVLLSCIAVGSIVGTVIKQNASAAEYLGLYSESTYRMIRALGLNDVYHSPWFFALLVLFAVNLVMCTLRRFIPLLKGEKEVRLPDEKALGAMPLSFFVDGGNMEERTAGLKKAYRTRFEGKEGLVLEKGNLSRYGALLIHASIILILIGGFVGVVAGYRGFMLLREGETKNRIVLRGENPRERPLDFSLKCKDFQVSFYPGGSPKDYVSTVEVIEGSRTIMEKQIRVNQPLSYKGIQFYQATYGKTPSFLFNVGGDRVTLNERDSYNKGDLRMMVVRFETSIHDFGPGVMVAYLDHGEPKTVWFLKDMEQFRERTIDGINIRLEDIKEDLYTGLEVSKDPGIWIVWTGFALILIGLYINFFMYHRRIFIRKVSNGFLVAGAARRNREAFKKEFEGLKGAVYGLSS